MRTRIPVGGALIETEEKGEAVPDQVFKPLAGTDPNIASSVMGRSARSIISTSLDASASTHVPGTRDVRKHAVWRKRHVRRAFRGADRIRRGEAFRNDSLERVGDIGLEIASARGTLRLMFSVDRAARTIRVGADGSLATTEVGLCFRKAIDETIARGFVSPNLTLPGFDRADVPPQAPVRPRRSFVMTPE